MILISYPLKSTTPLYPGTPQLEITPVKDFSTGDTARTGLITFSSHAGTHLDLPPHVCPESSSIDQILWDDLADLSPCCCIDIRKTGENPILPDDLLRIRPDPDLRGLLVRTGTWQVRQSDPATYSRYHPWLHPDSISVLRELFPSLSLLGVDLVSVTNPTFREYGREAHRKLLCSAAPILILEDLDLSSDLLGDQRFRLSIIPCTRDAIDGVPVFCSVSP
jgi:kynurenine formamidase